MTTKHARLGPSAAVRWMRCAGSVELCKDKADDPTIHSSEGTAAHKVSDDCFAKNKSPWDFVGKKIKADGRVFTVDADWAKALEPGIERIRDFGGKFYGEHKVKLDKWMPGQWGTLDRAVITKDLIVIGDLKFGDGVPVSPVRNEQLMIYALGFWWNVARFKTDAEEFLIIIDQPRYRGEGGGGEWRVTLDELLEFGKKVKRRAKMTYDEDAELTPGRKQCEWCPAAKDGSCPAYSAFNLAMMKTKFKDLDRNIKFGLEWKLPDGNKLSAIHRSYIVQHIPHIKKWLTALHDATLADAKAGRETPLLKLVVGRKGDRAWSSKKKAEKRLKTMLGDKAYNSTLISPTQAEKIMSARDYQRVQELIVQGTGKPSLVDAGDGRKAIVPTIAKFKNLDER